MALNITLHYSALRRGLQKLINLELGEGRALFWSFSYFFSLLCSYYILRPMRDEMGVAGGVEHLQWLFTGTFIAMLAVLPLFGWVASRYQRRQFLPYVYYFFIANILLFFLLFESNITHAYVARAFFIWVSVFNLFVVSVFWSFMTDLFRNAQGKRLFGVIASGGTVGALMGPALTAGLVQKLGANHLLLISAGLLAWAVLCIHRLIAWQASTQGSINNASDTNRAQEQPLGGSILAGIQMVVQSPYLWGICALILLFTSLSTILYFQQAQIIRDAFSDSNTRMAVFAGIDLAVNTLTLLMQLLLTGRIVKWLGLSWTLALIPLLLAIGFLALGVAPVLGVLLVVQVTRRAGNYAVMRPAREMLYVVLSREEKYKAKNFIDTVVYRGGDAISAWVYAAMSGVGLTLTAIAWIAVPFSLLWGWIAFQLGKQQHAMSLDSDGQT